ncbi:MAG: hypothetical protein E7346_04395 [Clostridiales bacterium]|nr:hypothetical protein [Clostridiales bacterium]
MNYEYTHKKKEYDLNKVENAQILFLNGDFINLSKKEIIDIEVNLYDKLVHFNNCYFPVAKRGFLKLKIIDKKLKYDNSSVYNQKEYKKDRKSYIENRCVGEGGIFAIRFFNELSWSDMIIGDIVAKKEEDCLIFSFLECQSLGFSDKDSHFINLKNVNKKDVRVLHLDFENCDGIYVYQNEIKDINLNFEKELSWNSEGYCRVIKNGYIRLKFIKCYNDGRRANIYTINTTPTTKDLEKRICGKGEDDIDICNLYISNYHCGYGLEKEEVITLNELSDYPDNYEEDDSGYYASYVTGYAKKEKDGSILIVFGKRRK